MRMARRALVVGGIALALPTRATAQSSRVPRVGFLTPASSDRTIPISAFRSALAELGYVERQNISLEFRLAGGDISRLPELAAELAALPADVIVVDGGIAVPAVMAATKTIPVVMATAGDPVALGYVQSLSRPGGNITGFSLISGELNQKRLDLLRAAFPKVEQVAVLFNPQNPTAQVGLAFVKEAGERLGIRATLVELSSPEGIAGLRSEALRPD